MTKNYSKKYYGIQGKYLQEHKNYFSAEQLQKDVNFIVDVLKLKRKDKILDLACGHGRHTIELKKRGFDIEGLDFSEHLLKLAKEEAAGKNLAINFYKQNIHDINLKTKYDKIFLFFSEFGLFDAKKVLNNVSKILKNDGLFLLDFDNVFRLVKNLMEHPNSPYEFDFIKMELKEKHKKGLQVRYYVIPELKNLFNECGFSVIKIFGDYSRGSLDIRSKRIIMVAKK